MLTSSQILILKLHFYLHEPAMEHVILAPVYPRKTYIANKSQISVYVWYVSYYCRAFTCSNGKGSWRFRVSWQQTSTSSITLDLAHLLMNVVSSNNLFNFEWTCVTFGAYNQNINKRQTHKLIWPCKPCYSSQILQ